MWRYKIKFDWKLHVALCKETFTEYCGFRGDYIHNGVRLYAVII